MHTHYSIISLVSLVFLMSRPSHLSHLFAQISHSADLSDLSQAISLVATGQTKWRGGKGNLLLPRARAMALRLLVYICDRSNAKVKKYCFPFQNLFPACLLCGC